MTDVTRGVLISSYKATGHVTLSCYERACEEIRNTCVFGLFSVVAPILDNYSLAVQADQILISIIYFIEELNFI